jgi:hypothetical protein
VSTGEGLPLHTKSWELKGAYLYQRMPIVYRDCNPQCLHGSCSCLFWLHNLDCSDIQSLYFQNIHCNHPFSNTSFAACPSETQAPASQNLIRFYFLYSKKKNEITNSEWKMDLLTSVKLVTVNVLFATKAGGDLAAYFRPANATINPKVSW